jgi:hypothetical protein
VVQVATATVERPDPGAHDAVPDRFVPMVQQTKQVEQGSTWVDCRAAGRDHDFVAHTTTRDAFYSVCGRCPVRVRTERYQKAGA